MKIRNIPKKIINVTKDHSRLTNGIETPTSKGDFLEFLSKSELRM